MRSKKTPGRAARGLEATSSRPSDDTSNNLKPNSPQRTVLDRNDRCDITPVYRAVIAEAARHLLPMDISLDKASEFAGLPDRFLNKALNPDTPSGRQMGWRSLQTFFDLIFPDGFELRIKRKAGPQFDALSLKYAMRYDKAFAKAKTRREMLAEWGRKGGLKHSAATMAKLGRRGARARRKKLPKEVRSELARRAARARWANRKGEPAS